MMSFRALLVALLVRDILGLPQDTVPTISGPVTVQAIGAYQYVGFYTEATNQRASIGYTPAIPVSGVTVEYCADQCSDYQLFGVEYGNECYCGYTISEGSIPSSGCDMTCGGNSSEYCGAGNLLDMYSYGGFTPVNAVTVQEIGHYSYLGCYTEATNGRALSEYAPPITNGGGSVEYCASQCGGYQYFGVEYGNECYCGDILNSGSVTADGCDMVCGGNGSEYCGGGNRLDIYQLAGLSCPDINGTVYTSSIGSIEFLVECGIDHEGGDIGMVYVADLVGCIDACANSTGCADVSLSDNACYLKQALGPTIIDSGLLGAKLYSTI